MNELPDGIFRFIEGAKNVEHYAQFDLCMHKGYGFWFKKNIEDAVVRVQKSSTWRWEGSGTKELEAGLSLHLPFCLVGE